MAPQKLRAPELSELPVVAAVERVLRRRWNLGLGWIPRGAGPSAGRAEVPQPPACRAVQAEAGGWAACRQSALKIAAPLFQGESARPALCHAGRRELAVPVSRGGELVGALVCGGFALEGDESADRVAALAPGELEMVTELLHEAAAAVAADARAAPAGAGGAGELERPYATRYSYDAIVGRSEPMQRLYAILDKVVDTESTVLVQGENGTGKELVARAIHYNSPRKTRRFVAQNCSAVNDNLLDSELFGHRRGAFTGAVADRRGLFEVADEGTFFLDEIGEMSPALQLKVLRAVQEGTFTPVGDTEQRQVDVRLIAATHRDLQAMVATGAFREDLFYRLNVINIEIPPLRERRGDIDLLIEHFLDRKSRAARARKSLSSSCRDLLEAYSWPGNVRELENEIERLVVLSGAEKVVGAEHLSPRIREPERAPNQGGDEGAESTTLPEATAALERRMLADALTRHGGNRSRAARDLGISRRNLIRLVQKYELD